jgi:[protein-PII] uridylyltransferase
MRIRQLETISVIMNSEAAYTSVTAVTRDASFLLSNLCGVLSANDANIFDAHIFTRSDGIVIDQFRVTSVTAKGALSPEQEEKIESDFAEVLRGTVAIEHLFERHRRRWKRRPQPLLHPNIRIDVEFENAPEFTIIDVYAPDMVGFLYQVTRGFSRLGLNISFAKIATRVDGIVDSFYVKDSKGESVISPERQVVIREKILHRIDQLVNVQLSSSSS